MQEKNSYKWYASLRVKLGLVIVLFLASTLGHVALNLNASEALARASRTMDRMGQGEFLATRALYLVNALSTTQGDAKTQYATELRKLIGQVDARFETLRSGSDTGSFEGIKDARVLENIGEAENTWYNRAKPNLENILVGNATTTSAAILKGLEDTLGAVGREANQTQKVFQTVVHEREAVLEQLQYIFFAVYALLALVALWIMLGITNSTRILTDSARRLADGDLTVRSETRYNDELGYLSGVFNDMTDNLRTKINEEQKARNRIQELLDAANDMITKLSSATSEVSAGTQQQASGAQEQSTAVSQTVSTVEEVVQTSEQAAERSKSVADSSSRAAEIGQDGREAIEETIRYMNTVKDQTELIGENILKLAEQGQAIGEIVAAVNDIAEQTNLLAINAGIEASKAGDEGLGFSVVAREIKELADESKQSTEQVRKILGEIQSGTNSAVMVMEEGSKRVDSTIEIVNRAGDTIGALVDAVDENATAARQISASINQQATGLSQIQSAMQDIDAATTQNASATKQTEEAIKSIDEMGNDLKKILIS